jgi:hypothetical protein
MYVHSDPVKITYNYYIDLWDDKKNFSDETLSKTRASDWFSEFKSGVTSVTNAEHLQNLSPNKPYRNVACIKKPTHGTDAPLSLSWLMSFKFHLKHSKAF